jgi:hypothetical protein
MRPLLLAALALTVALAAPARADDFDHYVNPVLARLVQGKDVTEVKKLTPGMILDHDRVLPKRSAAFLVVKTNGDRFARLLVHPAKQKVGDKALPILSVEEFVTYKEGEERQVLTSGKNQSLFNGFRFSLDLGQVVPEEVGGDLRFVADGDKEYVEPIGKARLYLVTRHDPAVVPKKQGKFVMGEKFDPKYFAGTYRLYDDGRRSGKLALAVGDEGEVTGSYYSDKDGAKYEVKGKIGEPKHSIEFTISLPRTDHVFEGMLFTGDGKAIAGTSRIERRRAAFYAVRQD